MKVLFVNHVDYLQSPPPEGIALLSSILKEQGHEIELFDTAFLKPQALSSLPEEDSGTTGITFYKRTPYSISDLVKADPPVNIFEKFIEAIERFKPDLVAVSAMTTNYEKSLELITQAREQAGKSFRVIFGGVHPTLMPDEVISENAIDYICIGEGDDALPELCAALESGQDPSGILNLYLKSGRKDGVIRNGLRPFTDLDSLPPPDFDLFDERYFFRPFQGEIYRGIFMSTSRGCPRGCAYCVNNQLNRMFRECGKNLIRFQSPPVVCSHIEALQKRYGVNWIRFSDDTFLMRPLEELHELAERLNPLKIMFGCAIDPVTVTEEKVKAAKEMGCVSMSIGIETGNEELRRTILGRRISNDQIRNAIRIIRRHDIKLSAFNMIGLPGETRENVLETIRFNKALEIPDANLYILYPFPGTKIYTDCKMASQFKDRIPPMQEAYRFDMSNMPREELLFYFKTFNLFLVLPEKDWDRIEDSQQNPGAYEGLVRQAQEIVDRKHSRAA